MPVERKSPVATQIRQIITVLGLGVLSAVLLAVGTLVYFNPSGSFRVSNILLSPDLAKGITYMDVSPETGSQVQLTLDQIEFIYFDDRTNTFVRRQIDPEIYKEFFLVVEHDTSLSVVPENVTGLFGRGNQAVLSLLVSKPASSDEPEIKRTFQTVEIQGHGDYYRIQIRGDQEGRDWAYFYHEGIYDKAYEVMGNP